MTARQAVPRPQLVVSASAGQRLAAARQWLAALPRDAECLILGSHPYAADPLVHEEVAEGGARFGVQRLTPIRLAARLAAAELARRGMAPVTTLSLAAVVTRAIHQLLESGAAGRFAPVARRPGFPHAVAATIEELRDAGIGAEALAAVPGGGPALGVLIERIEAELESLRLADRAAMFAIATAAIEAGTADGVGRPLLLLDLPLERRRERDLVAALARRAPRVLAVAPAGDAVAVGALEAMLGVDAAPIDGGPDTSSLARLQRHLFERSTPEPAPLDGSVTLASWPGESRESIEIARQLQAEAAAGTPFDRMAVLLRAPGAYRAHLEEALRRAAIPAWFARGTTRPDPAGRALLALLACAAENLSARRFAEYVSLAQVPEPGHSADAVWTPPLHDLAPALAMGSAVEDAVESAAHDPDAPVLDGAVRAPWRWERLLVDAAVIGGRERWQRRLEGLAEEVALRQRELSEDDARAAGLARTAQDLEHLRAFALPVIEHLAGLPAEARWEVWLARLRELAAAAIRHPAGVLAVLAELEPLGPVGPVDLMTVQHVLAPRLHDLMVTPETRPAGAVFVAPIDSARGMAFDVVFVPGLAEKLFPQRLIEDPLLPDESRRLLDAEGLATQESRVAAERLALRLAAGAARRRVVLSWPRVDLENARPRVPSFYGLEALRAAEGRLPGFDELRSRAESGGRARLGWPAPERAEEAIDDTEYDLTVLARLRDDDGGDAGGSASYLLSANPHLARALRARARRWLRRWTAADGLVDPDDETRAALARHRMGARSFSPTALEKYAACPYQFLLHAIHRLQPREDAEPLETIDPLTRGALFHEVQYEVLTTLRDRGHLPLPPARLELGFEVLDQAVLRVAKAYEERLWPAIPRVWSDGVTAIRADLREWLRRSVEDPGGWVPHRFELSFGLPEHARPTADAASIAEPVRVLGGALLRGAIDLVEKRSGGEVLRVTDHKTGKARVPAGAVVWGGAAMQPTLYALVAEAMLGAEVESGRLYYCTADGEFTERVIPLDEDSREQARAAIGVVGDAIERGFLPAAPRKDACVWCDYRLVCGPHEETRTARKPPDEIQGLLRLRELR